MIEGALPESLSIRRPLATKSLLLAVLEQTARPGVKASESFAREQKLIRAISRQVVTYISS